MSEAGTILEAGIASFGFFAKDFPYYACWGTGDAAVVSTQTSLDAEAASTTNDGSGHNTRPAVTGVQSTSTSFNDTIEWSATLTCLADITIKECGLNDQPGTAADLVTPPSGGNQITRAVFGTPISLTTGQHLDFVHKVVMS